MSSKPFCFPFYTRDGIFIIDERLFFKQGLKLTFSPGTHVNGHDNAQIQGA